MRWLWLALLLFVGPAEAATNIVNGCLYTGPQPRVLGVFDTTNQCVQTGLLDASSHRFRSILGDPLSGFADPTTQSLFGGVNGTAGSPVTYADPAAYFAKSSNVSAGLNATLFVGHDKYGSGVSSTVDVWAANRSGVDAPAYASISYSSATIAALVASSGSNTVDAAVALGPSASRFETGLDIFPNTLTAAGAAFVNRAATGVGLDLSLGSYATDQVKGIGFVFNPTGGLAVSGTTPIGIDLSSGTFATSQINGIGFVVNPAGALAISGTTPIGVDLSSGVFATDQVKGIGFTIDPTGHNNAGSPFVGNFFQSDPVTNAWFGGVNGTVASKVTYPDPVAYFEKVSNQVAGGNNAVVYVNHESYSATPAISNLGLVSTIQDHSGADGKFIEGIRSDAILVAGSHGLADGMVSLAAANGGVGYDDIIAYEGQVTNNSGVDAPVYTAFSALHVASVFLAGAGSTGTLDNAFYVNQFTGGKFMAGVVVGSGTLAANGAAFVNWANTAVGIDLSLASYSAFQVKGVGFTVDGSGNVSALNVPTHVVVQTFCPSGCTTTVAAGGTGTYTPTSGMVYETSECVGSGGGGGGVTQSTAGQIWTAAGGGGGDYSRRTSSAATVGGSQVVSIGTVGTAGTNSGGNGGNGGDSSLGALCVGKGGSGGTGSTSAVAVGGGAGGVAGTGDVTVPGSGGAVGQGASIITVGLSSGSGGASLLGGTRAGVGSGSGGSGGVLYGGGGSGAESSNNSAAAVGGAGAAGVVIVTEYVR
jgi:hypothetical protein